MAPGPGQFWGGWSWPQLCKSRAVGNAAKGPILQKGRVSLAGFWEDLEQSVNKSPVLEAYQSSLAGGEYSCLCI